MPRPNEKADNNVDYFVESLFGDYAWSRCFLSIKKWLDTAYKHGNAYNQKDIAKLMEVAAKLSEISF